MLPGSGDTLTPTGRELGGWWERSMGQSGQSEHVHLGKPRSKEYHDGLREPKVALEGGNVFGRAEW